MTSRAWNFEKYDMNPVPVIDDRQEAYEPIPDAGGNHIPPFNCCAAEANRATRGVWIDFNDGSRQMAVPAEKAALKSL